ncbi:IS1634 family transposase [Ruegeria sp.]|uniref:IS1634 family transposase n=1 Tax=Ruegeria sp. TaxID=1879320 RepID=UPI003AFF63E8
MSRSGTAKYGPDCRRKSSPTSATRLEKLHKKLKRSRKPGKQRGYGRFLAFPDSGDVTLDDAKIKAAAQWDGLHAIVVHGADELEAQDVIARYHQLWEIEACFRTNKHDLKIRPIYHWSPRRVRAHIAICYMAFCCLQHLRKHLDLLGHPMSPARIRNELNALQLSILRHKGTPDRYACQAMPRSMPDASSPASA